MNNCKNKTRYQKDKIHVFILFHIQTVIKYECIEQKES